MFHSLNADVIMWGYCVSNTIIIHFCLHFSLGGLRIISESTKQLLRNNVRIKWNDDFDDIL